MGLKLPVGVKPLWDFAVHVVIGAISFAVVLLVATGLALVVAYIETLSVVSPSIIVAATWAEVGLFYTDLFLFGLFLLSESLKLIRSLWTEWRR